MYSSFLFSSYTLDLSILTKRVIAHSDLNLIYCIDHSIRKRIKGHDEWYCHQISILEPGLGTRQKKNRLVKIMQFFYRLDMLLSSVYLTLVITSNYNALL